MNTPTNKDFRPYKIDKVELILRAETLIEKNHGVLYKSSISILKSGLRMAKESNNFSDLQEFVPIFEKKYKRLFMNNRNSLLFFQYY